jgi:hypothetical protein
MSEDTLTEKLERRILEHVPLTKVQAKFSRKVRVTLPAPVRSFRNFLQKCARVPDGHGGYRQYSFEGREPLIAIVELIDKVLGSNGDPVLADATIAICGGAQFGKTATELNLGAYCTGVAWLNWGFYLPNRDLVEGMVDTKFRPDVLDQIDWLARMTQVGKAVNKSGKSVNRKGAFSVTNGKQRSHGMILGLNRVPTSFTFDVTTLDEVDDIRPAREKFVRGRMTSSRVRLLVKIGTQRVAGRGQHKAWKDGSQGVMIHTCPKCNHPQNLEENWPRVCRVALAPRPPVLRSFSEGGSAPRLAEASERRQPDPFLTHTGDFRHSETGATVATYEPGRHYYFACVRCGTELDRTQNGFKWVHRRPERERLRNWSFRISQFAIAAIDISQIVAEWTRAVADPEAMATFLCDRKAMPESTAQKLTVEILERAKRVGNNDECRITYGNEVPTKKEVACAATAFGGLDTGRRCWFFTRETQAADVKRIRHVEQIPLGNLVERVTALFHEFGLQALFIDQAPATDEARTLALRLNGLEDLRQWPAVPKDKTGYISLPGGLRWNGTSQRWENLKCAVVAFTKRRLGAGITHGFDIFEKGTQTMFVPLIETNRFETIDRVVREFLTPAENVSEVIFAPEGKSYVRTEPAMRLPPKGIGAPIVLETLDEHLLAGSERVELRDGSLGDYVDACENHFLLADAYSGLAELEAGNRHLHAPEPIHVFENTRRSQIIAARGGRRIEG